MSKYNTLSKSQFCLTLASFFLLADYLSIKLTKKVSLYLFYITQIAKFLFNNNIVLLISFIIYLVDMTNNANIIHWSSIQYKRVTNDIYIADLYIMAHKLSIEK